MWLRLRELDKKKTRKAYTPSTFNTKWGVSIDDGLIQILAELRELLRVVKKLQHVSLSLYVLQPTNSVTSHNGSKPKVLEQPPER